MNTLNKYKNLLINIGLFTLNTVSTKLITFLLVPLYTYFLTAAQYGVTDMSLTVANLITPVITLSIGDAVTRYVIDDSVNEKHYISIGFWITVFSCAIMLFYCLFWIFLYLVDLENISGFIGSILSRWHLTHIGQMWQEALIKLN